MNPKIVEVAAKAVLAALAVLGGWVAKNGIKIKKNKQAKVWQVNTKCSIKQNKLL